MTAVGHADQLRRTAPVAREVAIVLAAVFGYFFTRRLISGRETVAYDNAERIVDIERFLGLFVEADLQSWILDHDLLIDVVNGIYIYGHWPVIAATFVWLLARHRPQYRRFRNALILSGATAFVFFVFLPTAPPRFLPELGFVDTVTEHTTSYRVLQPPALANEYAAVPSLHLGWNLLMGIAWAQLSSSRLGRAFGWTLPPAMFAAIVLTGNHYIVDGLIGGTLALAGLAVATHLDRVTAIRTRVLPIRLPRAQIELTQGQRESLQLHMAIAGKLAADPTVLDTARENVELLRRRHPQGATNRRLRQWRRLLDAGAEAVSRVLTSVERRAVDLREDSPFRGLLTEHERQAALADCQSPLHDPSTRDRILHPNAA